MSGFIDTLKDKLSPATRRRLMLLSAYVLPQPRRLAKLTELVDAWTAQYDALTAQYDALTAQYAALTAQYAALTDQLHAQRINFEEQIASLQRELAGVRTAYTERVTYLENHNAELTDAVVTRETKLQQKAELDYQILMTHQGLLAEFKDIEPRFQKTYERCKAYTMTSVERLYSLYKAVGYLVDAPIPGDLAECGVWRGGSCMMMAHALLASGSSDRRILMFDTYEGHPEPDPERDADLWGNSGHEEWRRETNEGAVKGWGLATLDEVRDNMRSTGYPSDKLEYIKGMVEDTVPVNLPDRLGLLRLDTDWYESTRVALFHLYPRLVPGGVLILDDYGHYQGQRQAVDEYFTANGHRPLLHRIDYSCRVAVKPSP